MQAYVGGSIDMVCKVECKIGFMGIFWKCVISPSQADQQSFSKPSSYVISVEPGIPRIYLVGMKASQVKQFVFKF